MNDKKRVRKQFKDAVFKRDGYKCRVCEYSLNISDLDAHHITDRNEMPSGGYVPENGITLCPICHIRAEKFHTTGEAQRGYSPDELYALIKSSKDKATRVCRG